MTDVCTKCDGKGIVVNQSDKHPWGLMPEFCDKDDEQNVLNNIELQRGAIVMSNQSDFKINKEGLYKVLLDMRKLTMHSSTYRPDWSKRLDNFNTEFNWGLVNPSK